MGLIKNLMEVWRIEMDKRRKQQEKYRIEYAFTCGGTKYYRFADIANLPYERGLQALSIYNEVDMRCSREYLLEHVAAVEKILHDGKKVDIFKLNTLNEYMRQRLELTADVDLMYKLASVCFFDSTENPTTYEPEYAEKKIAKWRKDKKVTDFFSQTPLLELMPFLRKVEVDLDTYTELNTRLNKTMSETLQSINSPNK